MSKTKYPIRHIPLVLLDNGWYVKASDWEESHITFFIVSKYTGQSHIQYFTDPVEATRLLHKLSFISAKKRFNFEDANNEEDI